MFIKRLYFWTLLVLCFVFGAVSGTVYETMASKESKRSRRVRTSDVVKQMAMTEAQRTQLNRVLEGSRKRMIALNKSMRPELAQIRQDTRAQIREILTPEQRIEFDELIAKQDKKHRSRTKKQASKPSTQE